MSRRVLVVGAGMVGTTCAQRLARDGFDVTIIERDEERARQLLDQLDVQVVAGNGSSIPVLREAGLDEDCLLLAVTDSDEVNMITALVAGTAFRVKTQVVRLRSDEYRENIEELGSFWPGKTHGISPDRVAADRVTALLRVPHALDVAELLGGRVVVAGFRIEENSPFAGRTLAELGAEARGERFLVAAIWRMDRVLIPEGSTRLEPRDILYFSCLPGQLPAIVRRLGYTWDPERRVVVGGGGHVGRMVARAALGMGLRVAVIEHDRASAERLALELERALVLHGEVTDEELLLEAGIERASTYVAATGDQERNLLSSVLAKRLGTPRVIPLVDHPAYLAVAEATGIDAVVSPRLATVSALLRFVRGGHVEETASLLHELVEVSVVEIDASSPLAGRTLAEASLPAGVLVTAIARDGDVLVPGGRDRALPGDRVVVFSLAETMDAAARALRLDGGAR